MKKIESTKKTVSSEDLKKALSVQTGVRAGLLSPPGDPGGCLTCGISADPGGVRGVKQI